MVHAQARLREDVVVPRRRLVFIAVRRLAATLRQIECASRRRAGA
jgi:hypothetical protein